MAALHRKLDDDARAILWPHLAREEWHRGIERHVIRVDRKVVDVEGTQIGHQQFPGRIGAADFAVFVKHPNSAEPVGVDDGEAVVDRVGREQRTVEERHRTRRFGTQRGLRAAEMVGPGRKQRPRRLVLDLAELMRWRAARGIQLIPEISDRNSRLCRLDLGVARA
ncbi:hypothetical protein GALL_548830 [mine drainage metagenome]|uniref:Uncharacterized protein n=1 Tax=mine drainage metagenome TaxID=410659 RepID=A0A1J5NZA5_9ZZZZ